MIASKTSKIARGAGSRPASLLTSLNGHNHGRSCSCTQCHSGRSYSTGSGPSMNIMDRLDQGPVIGDGGFVFGLEKRGYVMAGPWTPEATIENADAVKQYHTEFLRAGADVMQTFTFYASEDKLENRGNVAAEKYGMKGINSAACDIAREVANKNPGTMVAGGICQTPTYLSNMGKTKTQDIFEAQCKIFTDQKVDFMIAEYYEHIEEMEWAIEVCKATGLPTAANMCIGPDGDMHGVSAGECAIRMAQAGAEIIGVNCHFDPFISLDAMQVMKDALDGAGLKAELMIQPVIYHTPDANKQGFIDLPEFPFALEPRVCTRWEIHEFARRSYDMGIRYIGGCCGFEPYHIRAIAEELKEERGNVLPKASDKHLMWGGGLEMHTKPWVRARANKQYWQNIKPASGRPQSPSLSSPDSWGVTQGSEDLKQVYSGTAN